MITRNGVNLRVSGYRTNQLFYMYMYSVDPVLRRHKHRLIIPSMKVDKLRMLTRLEEHICGLKIPLCNFRLLSTSFTKHIVNRFSLCGINADLPIAIRYLYMLSSDLYIMHREFYSIKRALMLSNQIFISE